MKWLVEREGVLKQIVKVNEEEEGEKRKRDKKIEIRKQRQFDERDIWNKERNREGHDMEERSRDRKKE